MDEHEHRSGVIRAHQEFFDDPDAALGLRPGGEAVHPGASVHEEREPAPADRRSESREAEQHELDEQRRAHEKLAKERPEHGGPSNPGAYAGINERIAELQREGHTFKDASAIALEESRTADLSKPRIPGDDYLGASIPSLMKHEGGKGHSGGGGGQSRQRSVPKRCIVSECTLQYCDHGPKGKPGRASKESAGPRNRVVLLRISAKVEGLVQRMMVKDGLSRNDVFALLIIAHGEGRDLAEVIAEWKASYPGVA